MVAVPYVLSFLSIIVMIVIAHVIPFNIFRWISALRTLEPY